MSVLKWSGFFASCRAYDRAAIKFRGLDADINFNLSDYEEDLKQVERASLDQIDASVMSVFLMVYDGWIGVLELFIR